jgi:hypothetical protein
MNYLIPPLSESDIVWIRHYGNLTETNDCDGRLIKRSEYGKLTACGWEIDHVTPSMLGGLDVYANKRPRHWQGNRSAGGLLNAYVNTLINPPSTPPAGLVNVLAKKPGGLF